jgi:hypothetical protein
MSPQLVMELTEIVAQRYLKAKRRKEKTKILDEYCENTGRNRKYAITKIREILFKPEKQKKKRGRKKKYDSSLDHYLIQIWEAYNGICPERLHPFLKEGIKKLEQFGYLNISEEEKEHILSMSLSTLKRKIRGHKKRNLGIKGLSATKPGYLLKKEIPIQTISWDTGKAGFCEIDLVAHCGGSLLGDLIYTLQFVDIKTTWTERVGVMGKSQYKVFEGIRRVHNTLLPFPLLGVDSDNGGEFINAHLLKYCQENNISFTRSRPYMSKDNAHIEQKNYTTVRKILGYDRFDTEEHLALINDLYDNELRLYINFFQPTLKMVEKIRIGSKYKRKYDEAKTPFERVLACPDVSDERKERLKAIYKTLNPVQLKQSIEKKIATIISLNKKSGFILT